MIRWRTFGAPLMLAALALMLLGLSLCWSSQSLPNTDVLKALFGQGPPLVTKIIWEWRLPRALMALVLGAALGLSGALFQSLLRNPLGSPDVIGFNTGAYSGVLVAIILAGAAPSAVTWGALAGGVITALLIHLLAAPSDQGYARRLILVGIGMRALLMAFNTWLVLQATLDSALSAGMWSAGSLNGITWAQSVFPCVAIVITVASVVGLSRALRILVLGDDVARGLGLNVRRLRAGLLLCGVVLTAAATAVAGPISFVALVAPQLARHLHQGALALTSSALMGGCLLLGADLLAQHAGGPYQLPVGIVTVTLGGLYLLLILLKKRRHS